MPEDTVVATSVVAPVTPAPDSASAAPVADPQRTAIINKYEERYGQPPATQVEQPVVTQDPPAPTQAQPDYAAMVADLKSQLDELKRTTVPLPPVNATPTEKADWLKLLAEGKKGEGEAALAAMLRESMGAEIQQNAVKQAVEQMTAERDISSFLTEIRAANADILPMEQYIANAVTIRLNSQQSTIKSPADYVTAYKQIVNEEIVKARQLSQTLRGSGKAEAQTRITQVLQSQTLTPNAVNQNREQAPQSGDPQVETASDYIASRQAWTAKGRGMATA